MEERLRITPSSVSAVAHVERQRAMRVDWRNSLKLVIEMRRRMLVFAAWHGGVSVLNPPDAFEALDPFPESTDVVFELLDLLGQQRVFMLPCVGLKH